MRPPKRETSRIIGLLGIEIIGLNEPSWVQTKSS
jgi:hypothetical protein